MTTLRAVVADDEVLGRRGIVSRLAKADAIEVVAQCGNGREAIHAVRELHPDLLFLDVQMPGLDGFEVVRALPEDGRPHVIFVTAWDRHALRAFEVQALDYLVKPIDDERFAEALARARHAVAEKKESEIGRRVLAAVGGAHPPDAAKSIAPGSLPGCFVVRDRGRVTFVRHADVDWIEGAGDYVRLHARERSWLMRDTLSAVEKRLDPRKFLRIHRSTIVRLDRIRELQPFENGDAAVHLRDGLELRASRSYRSALARLIRPR